MADQCSSPRGPTIVILAGVMCRGAAGGIHPGAALLQKNVILPLRSQGKEVKVWGFNNIPDSIDGDAVPSDGGRSYFGHMDHYESWEQDAIDSSTEAAAIAPVVKSLVFANGRAGCLENIVRLLFLQDKACARLRGEVNSGELDPGAQVILMTPDMCLFGGSLGPKLLELRPGHLGVLQQKDDEVEDGFLVCSAENVLEWHMRHLRVTRLPATRNYEAWCNESTSGFQVTNLRPDQPFLYCHYNGRTFRGHQTVSSSQQGWFPWKRYRIGGLWQPLDNGQKLADQRPAEYCELKAAVKDLEIASNDGQ